MLSWQLAKKYWWILLVAGVMIYAHVRISNLKEVLEISNASHKEQISQLKELHEEELKKRDQLVDNYKKQNEQIEKKYKNEINNLKKKRSLLIKETVKMFYEDPEGIKNEIIKKYGFEHIDPKGCSDCD